MPSSQSRPRAQSLPPPRRPRPGYTYTPLSSARHIRLLQIVSFDAVRSQLYVTFIEQPISTVAGQFTALSYTWGSALDHFEPPSSLPTISSSTPGHSTAIKRNDFEVSTKDFDLELVILPPSSFATFRRTDDLAPTEGRMIDVYTPSEPEVSTLPVRGNLAGFFRSYCLRGYYPDARMRDTATGEIIWTFAVVSRLWIDAVCIDQDNAAEKACQIPLMGEVYHSAGRVLAWLGADERYLPTFLWFHRVVYPAVVAAADGDGEVAMAKFRERSFVDEALWRDVVGIERPVGRGRSWAAAWKEYWAFYRTRRYFHRAWIVQEVAVAGRLEMMAGQRGEELRWDDMYKFAEFLVEVGWFAELDDMGDSWLEKLGKNPGTVRGFGITDIGTLQRQLRRRWFEKTGWPMYWWEVVTTVRKRDCFLKEDKVFATVGTLQQVLPSGTPLPFPVDAAATPEEVYIHAATALLLHWPELPGLSFVDHQDHCRLPNLPSWVPDLTSHHYTNPIGTFFSGFKACVLGPDTVIPPRRVTPTGELHLRGVKLDTLSFKTQPCAPLSTDFAIEALSFLAAMPFFYPHAMARDQDGVLAPLFRESALVDALTCYQAANPHRGTVAETQRLLKGFRAWLVMALGSVYSGSLMREGQPWYDAATLAEYRAKWAKVEGLIRGLGARALVPPVEEVKEHGEQMMSAGTADQPWPGRIKPPTVFKYQIGSMMLWRCLFRTAEGRVGVCTQTCEPGDEVWFLEGGAVPYVLRPCKEEGGKRNLYMFYGECCVVGSMYGEMVKNGYIVPDKLEDVVIR